MFTDSYWLTISLIVGIDLVYGVSDQNYRFIVMMIMIEKSCKGISRSSSALKHSFKNSQNS